MSRLTPTVEPIIKPTDPVILDLLDDATEFIDSPANVRATRKALVTGVLPGEYGLTQALRAPGMPALGESYPGVPGLVVSERRARYISPDSTTKVEVTISYTQLPEGANPLFGIMVGNDVPPQLELTTTLQKVRTNMDVNGDIITVDYNLTPTDVEGPPEIIRQVGVVEYMQPMTVFRYRRREARSPGDIADRFRGKVNKKAIFNNHPPRTWLVTAINGTSEDGGKTYNVTYEMQRNTKTWDAFVWYIDPATGQPGEYVDARSGSRNGMTQVQLYEEVDFELMQLYI